LKLMALLVAADLPIAACEDEDSIRNLTSFQSVSTEVRQVEFNSVQSSVVLAMLDNGVNPITPVTAPTNDMGTFPTSRGWMASGSLHRTTLGWCSITMTW
jgi:hypothetical protein